jgi:predicted phage baseplate assembly protein
MGARPSGLAPAGEESEAALIEAAALLVDQMIYRLNQVPDRLHSALLDLIGVHPYPSRAARTLISFWLTRPVAEPEFVLPTRLQVSAPGREDRDGPVFTTTETLRLHPVEAVTSAVQTAAGATDSPGPALRFGDPPRPGDAILIGLDRPAPAHTVRFELACELDGLGSAPDRPPLAWEAWTGNGWAPCDVASDGTAGLCQPGAVVVHLPGRHAYSVIAGERAAWLRCRLTAPQPEQPSYVPSPAIAIVRADTIGGSVEAVHGRLVAEEILGTSTGLPGQRFRLRETPIVEPDDSVTVEVWTDGAWVPWRLVPSFTDSHPADLHAQVAAGEGEVRFGPAIRQPDGSYQQYGAVPPGGALIRIRRHLIGGGRVGNIGPGLLTVLRTPVPYVASVENRVAGFGGVDAESEEDARARIPLVLRSRNRAVTAADYEHLALEAAPELARVRCLAHEPGVARLVVVPFAVDIDGRITYQDLVPADETFARVTTMLDRCRVIGTRLIVEPAWYQGVTIAARLRGRPRIDADALRHRALAALYRYYNPLAGGPDATGWPFGRPVVVGEAFALLQRIPGVDFVDDVQLFAADPATGERGQPVPRLELAPGALVFSHEHQVVIEA